MTGLTPKPDEGPARRRFRFPRLAVLLLAACIAFGVIAVALLQLLPPPHSKNDYMIAGTVATLAALLTIFAGLVLGARR